MNGRPVNRPQMCGSQCSNRNGFPATSSTGHSIDSSEKAADQAKAST
jgi:hypothetical protein